MHHPKLKAVSKRTCRTSIKTITGEKLVNYRFKQNCLESTKKGSRRKFSHAASRFPLSLDRCSRRSPGTTKSSRATVPRRIRSSLPFVVKRCLYIHAIRIRMNSVMRATDTYSWRNSFAGNREEGSVSSHRAAPLPFSSSHCLSSGTRVTLHSLSFQRWISIHRGIPIGIPRM